MTETAVRGIRYYVDQDGSIQGAVVTIPEPPAPGTPEANVDPGLPHDWIAAGPYPDGTGLPTPCVVCTQLLTHPIHTGGHDIGDPNG